MSKDPMLPSDAPPPRAKASAELHPLFGNPTNDWAALYEIADVIRKALRDPEFIRLANEPDMDKSSRVDGEDTPERAHMRCVAEEAINAVLNRIKISSRLSLRPSYQTPRRALQSRVWSERAGRKPHQPIMRQRGLRQSSRRRVRRHP